MTKIEKNIAHCAEIYAKYEHLMLERFTRPIENLDVRPRYHKALRAAGITNIGILAMLNINRLQDLKGIGMRGWLDIDEAFEAYGVHHAIHPSRLLATPEEDVQLLVEDILAKSSTAQMREFNRQKLWWIRWAGHD
jgi:hypothetical protein